MSSSGIRTRRNELVRKGLLQDTGDRRKLKSGRHAIVHGLTMDGYGIADDLSIGIYG
jgi:hypothetical protein